MICNRAPAPPEGESPPRRPPRGLEGCSLTLTRKWLKFLRHLNHRERSLDKLPFLLSAIGPSNVVKKLASHLAQPCG
jgi:hypothetical protein